MDARVLVAGPRIDLLLRALPSDHYPVYADQDTVIVLWDGRGIANDGQLCKNNYAWFISPVVSCWPHASSWAV